MSKCTRGSYFLLIDLVVAAIPASNRRNDAVFMWVFNFFYKINQKKLHAIFFVYAMKVDGS